MDRPFEPDLMPGFQGRPRWSPYGAVHRAYHRLGRRLAAELDDLHLSGSEALVIRLIGRPDNVSPATIVETLGLAPSTVTSLLRRLEARGFVARIRAADDGRYAILRLTPEGRYAEERVVQAMIALEADLEGGVGREELEALSAVADALDTLATPRRDPEAR